MMDVPKWQELALDQINRRSASTYPSAVSIIVTHQYLYIQVILLVWFIEFFFFQAPYLYQLSLVLPSLTYLPLDVLLFLSKTWKSFEISKSKIIEYVTGSHVIIVINCLPLINVELLQSNYFLFANLLFFFYCQPSYHT
jgi:hypothetical protein